jgi:enolase
VKVNQIGTLTEALAAVETAHKAGGHRSGANNATPRQQIRRSAERGA